MSTKRVIGPFELGDRIGVGGMGIVYRAVYTKTGTPVAIKILSPDLSNEASLQRRFEREISILKKLQHPHIVRYYGGGKVGTQRFYAMELVRGGSLENYLETKQRLSWEETIQIALQIAQALEHAHTAGVIHRDLKPANLLLTADQKIKLTDFGIARDTTATALTAAGRTVGTYAYMAPEQIRGKPPVDKKTDLYALGCVLFEMLTGETPFDSENQGEMLMMHLNEEPRRVTALAPDCPIWLEELIFDLLEKDPEQRPYDALAVQVKLEEILKKVEEQQSIAQATLKGEPTRSGGTTQGELKDILGKKKKKKKKKDKSPLYERGWFLAVSLATFCAALGWFTYTRMYPSEAALLARVEKITAGSNVSDWGAAREDLQQMLARFPDGQHVGKARDYLDQIEMNLAERQARVRSKKGLDPTNEAEARYLAADGIEKDGDRLLALDKYESLAELFKSQDEFRPYVMLAKRQIAKIKSEDTAGFNRAEYLSKRLSDAEKLMDKGQMLEARKIWQSIASLYEGNRELAQQVDHAKKRIAGDFAGTWPPAAE
ncbi:MAG: serine/threonine-protein kinase [Planctomycetaceae bacterium]